MASASNRRQGSLGAQLLRSVAVLALTFAATLAMVRLAPGFGLDERLADASLGEQTRREIEQSQSGQSLWEAALGGTSASYGQPVKELLARRWRATAGSVALGWLLAWAAALGSVMAWYSARPLSGTLSGVLRGLAALPNLASLLLLSTPAALLGLLAFLYRLPVAVAIAAAVFPLIYRFLSSRFRAAGGRWAVLGAEARGLARWRVAVRHILYPERGEVAMLGAVSFKWALSAAIPAEVFAGQAGLGEMVWKAAESRDLALVLPLTLAMAALVQMAQVMAGFAQRRPA